MNRTVQKLALWKSKRKGSTRSILIGWLGTPCLRVTQPPWPQILAFRRHSYHSCAVVHREKLSSFRSFETIFVTEPKTSQSAMPIDLYYVPGSSPCRNVLLAAKAVGVDLNLILTDLKSGAHLTPEFIKMNPQHTVPTLNDNGFIVTESRAAMTYLADQYGKDDSYYPKDPKKRALVNQRLYFDMGTLYQRFGDTYYPHMFGGAPLDEEKKKKLNEALGFLDGFLAKTPFVAGDSLTLADLAIVASISTIEAVGHDFSSYKKITSWYEKVKGSAPGYKEANEEGAKAFAQMFKAMTGK